MNAIHRTFVIATTGDRVSKLERLLISLYPFLESGWEAIVVAQRYTDSNLLRIQAIGGKNVKIIAFPYLLGAHSAKIVALNSRKSDIWCSLDDDMFAIKRTNWNKMADILLERIDIGFLSGNWAKTLRQADAKSLEDKLVPQKLVFTGGGLMFRDDVADIIQKIPNEPYLFDDCLWSMYAYINGYDNFRYRGSVAVHEICTIGGRRTWIAETSNRVLPPDEYLRVRKGSKKEGYNQYLICVDNDLTKLAHEKHIKNKRGKQNV